MEDTDVPQNTKNSRKYCADATSCLRLHWPGKNDLKKKKDSNDKKMLESFCFKLSL